MAAKTASVSGNWGDAATWGGAAKPTTSDTVTINDGITVTINEATAAVQSLTIQAGGTGATIVFTTFNLSVAGSITLEANTVITAGTTGELRMTASGTLTTAGAAITTPFTMTGASSVLTLGSNATVAGLVTLGNATAQEVTAGAGTTLICQGGFTMSLKLIINATAIVQVAGGTMTGSSTTGNSISGAGTIELNGAITTGTVAINAANITILVTVNNLSGTGTFYFTGTATTITGALTVPNVNIKATALTLTLTGALIITTSLKCGMADASVTFAGGQAVTVGTVQTVNNDHLTINRDVTGTFTVTTLAAILGNNGITITGAQDLSVANYYHTGGATVIFPASQTLTVTTSFMQIGGFDTAAAVFYSTLQSDTATTAMNLVIGAACTVVGVQEAAFTDVNVTGKILYNPYGGTLTRTTGVVNFATNASLQSIRSYGFQG